MIVWIASYPRSGNSFFRIALHRLYGVRSAPDPLQPRPAEDRAQPWREVVQWPELSHEEMAASDELYFIKNHALPPDADSPAIYLLRDGRDALVSYAWFSLSSQQTAGGMCPDRAAFERALHDLIIDRRSPYGVWSHHVVAWLARPRTAVVRFERLIDDPARAVSDSLQQLGIELPEPSQRGSVPTFAELQAIQPRHYRRGGVGCWQNEFSPHLLQLFWKHHREGMRAAGYGTDDATTG